MVAILKGIGLCACLAALANCVATPPCEAPDLPFDLATDAPRLGEANAAEFLALREACVNQPDEVGAIGLCDGYWRACEAGTLTGYLADELCDARP